MKRTYTMSRSYSYWLWPRAHPPTHAHTHAHFPQHACVQHIFARWKWSPWPIDSYPLFGTHTAVHGIALEQRVADMLSKCQVEVKVDSKFLSVICYISQRHHRCRRRVTKRITGESVLRRQWMYLWSKTVSCSDVRITMKPDSRRHQVQSNSLLFSIINLSFSIFLRTLFALLPLSSFTFPVYQHPVQTFRSPETDIERTGITGNCLIRIVENKVKSVTWTPILDFYR